MNKSITAKILLKYFFQFSSKRKMGGEEFSERYREKLEQDLDDSFSSFRSHNESKNIFKAARTPAVFFALAIIMYILSGIFGLFGIYTLANSANLVMGAALLTLAMWAYIRYSGELSEIGSQLDRMADYLWENVSLTENMLWIIKMGMGVQTKFNKMRSPDVSPAREPTTKDGSKWSGFRSKSS